MIQRTCRHVNLIAHGPNIFKTTYIERWLARSARVDARSLGDQSVAAATKDGLRRVPFRSIPFRCVAWRNVAWYRGAANTGLVIDGLVRCARRRRGSF